MKMTLSKIALAIASLIALESSALAHRAWLLPSATVLSGEDPWVTVDAAISNDLFYFEHHPMRLDNLVITAPDGSKIDAQNSNTGKYRSTFDVNLKQPGTYRMAVVNDGLFASYKLNGENKRRRGSASKLKDEIPADATDVKLTQSSSRNEIFVTSGKPSEDNLAASGKGLELLFDTHPNDLFANEEAKFRLVLDGAPVKGVEVEIVPGGNRYRDKLNDAKVTTGEDGNFSITWPTPGMYWIEASVRDEKATVEGAQRRASYVATFEVLPQ